MPDSPTAHTWWMLNPQRESRYNGGRLLLLVGSIGAIAGAIWGLMKWRITLWPDSSLVPFLVVMAANLWLSHQLSKWASLPVVTLLSADGLVTTLPGTDATETVHFSEMKTYRYVARKDSFRLVVTQHNGRVLRLRPSYQVKYFCAMADEFERRYKQYQWQQQPPRPRPHG